MSGGVRRVCWWRGEWRGEEGMLVGVRRGCCDAVFCPHFVMCSSYHNWKQRGRQGISDSTGV